jgi:hypothetical protein
MPALHLLKMNHLFNKIAKSPLGYQQIVVHLQL